MLSLSLLLLDSCKEADELSGDDVPGYTPVMVSAAPVTPFTRGYIPQGMYDNFKVFAASEKDGAQTVNADGGVDKGRRAHIRQVDVLPLQELLVAGIHLGVHKCILLFHSLRLLGDNIHQCNDFTPLGKIQIGLDMGISDAAGADDGNLNHD